METTGTIENAILTVLAIVILIIIGGALYSFVLAIFQFIFSKGEQEKVKKAWSNIRYMIIGIILSIMLLIVFPFAFKKLQIPGYKVYTASNIFKKASDLIKIFRGVVNDNQGQYYSPSSAPSSSYSEL